VSGYTIVNLMEIENRASEDGPMLDARFARSHIGSDHIGVSHLRYAPDRRSQKGHSHREQEEVYVVLGFAAGPEGLELLAIGADRPEGGDGLQSDEDWWGES
jgi:uncharacterized cupin superfamily protein